MKITFYSNFMNHHQLPFCLAMRKYIGNEFTFIATEKIPNERLELGYKDLNKEFDFIIRSYEGEKSLNESRILADTSDVVIIGSAPNEFLDIRMKKKQINFYI